MAKAVKSAERPLPSVQPKEEPKTKKYAHIRFTNVTEPGKGASFSYNGVFYNFEHGVEYNIPLEIAEHLNSLKKPIYGWKGTSEFGKSSKEVNKYDYRFSAQILSIYDKEEE